VLQFRTHRRESTGNNTREETLMDLTTTNVLLGIMAAVSLLEAAAVIALLGGGVLMYRKVARLVEGIEQRQVAPVVVRVNGILDDVKAVSGIARGAADGADS